MNRFMDGFQAETGLSDSEVVEQWSGFSAQLSDLERAKTERGGYRRGQQMGRAFLRMYPETEATQ